MTLLRHWPLSIFDHGEQQLVNNGERRWFGGKVKGRAHAWSAKNCTLWKNLLSFSTSLPFDSLELGIGLHETKMRRKPFLRSHLCTSRLITRVPQSSFLYFYKISQKKVFSVSSVEGGLRWLVAWKLKKKNADWRHLSGGGHGASRLLWPHDPSIIDDVTFFHEQIQKPFASMHATAPGLAVLFAVNFIHMSKKCTIKGVTVKGTAHRRLTVRVREPDCFQCKHPASAASNALRTAVYLDAGRHVDYSIFPNTDTLWSGVFFLPHSLSKWTLHSYCTLTASSVRTLRPVGHQMIQRYLLWLVCVRGEKITFWDVWHQRQRQYKANN